MSGPDERALSAPAPLSADHELDQFNSGMPPLDDWLKRRARQNEAGGASRTYVIAEGRRVVGYYSLAAGSVLHAEATGRVRRNMPDPVPAALLGRLAIDQAWQGRGLGSALLRDAVLRVVGAAETIGVRALLVHAISEEAKAFYEHWGFQTVGDRADDADDYDRGGAENAREAAVRRVTRRFGDLVEQARRGGSGFRRGAAARSHRHDADRRCRHRQGDLHCRGFGKWSKPESLR